MMTYRTVDLADKSGFKPIIFGLLAITFSFNSLTLAATPRSVDFVTDVYPILETYCIGCHTQDDAQGGLMMHTYDALMAGGDNGAALTAHEVATSPMFLMASGKLEPVMPPDDMEGPNENELAILEAWIQQGAAGPDGDMPTRRKLRFPKIDSDPNVTLPITAIAISSDGRRRATARFGEVTIDHIPDESRTRDRTASSQPSLTSPTPASVISEIPGKVNSLQFNGDGTRLLIASGVAGAYGVAAIYDLESIATTSEPVVTFAGHQDILYSAIWSPDESLVATAGYDRDIILWDTQSGDPLRTLEGHNGAIFDLDFSPDGSLLASGCADETVKIWKVDNGQRLDTLSQSEGEVLTVAFSPDGKQIVAAGADSRLRVWRVVSKTSPSINPLLATRFVDSSPLVNFTFVHSNQKDSGGLLVLSESGSLKLLSQKNWNPTAAIAPLNGMASDLCITPDGKTAIISLMNGQIERRELPNADTMNHKQDQASGDSSASDKIFFELEDEPVNYDLTSESKQLVSVTRGAVVKRNLNSKGDFHQYEWSCHAGEVWAIEANALPKSEIDPMVRILDQDGHPVLRVRLQAVRDTYFTFRGKNSQQSNDFRLFAWEELHLDDYLYASGEVTRLSIYPRGPDSGFNVYPGIGSRQTYFGTTHTTHALGEPAYIVRPLLPGQVPTANGLPVFDIPYENDDDPERRAGKNSRLIFVAPKDGTFRVQIEDARSDGGDDFDYELSITPARPRFTVKANPLPPLNRGSGREWGFEISRLDGFDGPVEITADGFPPELRTSLPATIQPGQKFAQATIWLEEGTEMRDGKTVKDLDNKTLQENWREFKPQLFAKSLINGVPVEQLVTTTINLKPEPRPKAIARIEPVDPQTQLDQPWTLQVRRGETVSAKLVVDRIENFEDEISFGKELSARGAPHGIYVDNIGLNGLLVRRGENERQFFITADPVTELGLHSFFLTANVKKDGKLATPSIVLEVLP